MQHIQIDGITYTVPDEVANCLNGVQYRLTCAIEAFTTLRNTAKEMRRLQKAYWDGDKGVLGKAKGYEKRLDELLEQTKSKQEKTEQVKQRELFR